MQFLIICFKILMNFIYAILKLFPTKNKVTFISRQSNEISIDFKMLVEEINKQSPDVKNVVLMKRLENGLVANVKYFFHMMRQMYHLSLIHI